MTARPHLVSFVRLLAAAWIALSVGSAQGQVQPAQPVPTSKVQFDKRSEFERVLVVDEGDSRFLRFGGVDGDDQSMITLSDPKAIPMEYVRLAGIATKLVPKVDRVLMVGVGGGTFGSLVYNRFPRAHIDAVDINPVVVEVAYRFFHVPKSERYVMHVTDGAKFVAQEKSTYDVILLDAYGADGVPSALASVAFFKQVLGRLNSEGVTVLNLSLDERDEEMLAARFSQVFPHVLCASTSDGYNVLLYGSRRAIEEREDTERPLRSLPESRVPGGCGTQH